jgi:asparagine synthase (glutamine-hydrolysing)
MDAASNQWSAAIDLPGLQVLYTGARAGSTRATVFPNGDGAVLGTLFNRTPPALQAVDSMEFEPADADTIVASTGRRLIETYWGRYVAFLRSADGSKVWILRDPSGGLPCYFVAIHGVQVFFSWTEDALAAGLETCTVDWHYLSRFVCCSDPQSRSTGIREIQEVHAGERIELRSGEIAETQQLWDAVRLAHSDPIEDVEEAVHAIRSTTEQVTWAWASRYGRVVHLLSGGLDSSVLLRCLQSAPTRPALTCLNYFGSEAASEDERALARLAATGADCELIERPQRSGDVQLKRMLDCARTAVPLGMLYRVLTQDGERQLARRAGADAYFTGVGGDAVFYQGPVALALADHLRAFRGSRGFLDFALAVARMENLSLVSALAQACKTLLPGVPDHLVRSIRPRTVVRAEVLSEAAREPEFFWHRWPAAQGRLSPAKLRHLYYMRGNGIHFYSPFAETGDPDYVCPLLSQPLMELCLRIPVYLHTAAGWDRALERRAFNDVLPPNIILRRRKGAIGAEMSAILQANLPFVRELMLDGQLVKERLLDRRKVEQALAGAHVRLSPAAGEILGDHLSVEAWLQRWTR